MSEDGAVMDQATFAIRRITDFVSEHVTPRATILDVGAGRGVIARELGDLGFQVTAIDPSPKAVERAKANGVKVLQAPIGTFVTDSMFDVALLSMVAHHVHPLGLALDKTREVVRPGGRVLIEDFAVEDADVPSAAWHYQTLAAMKAVGLFESEGADLMEALEDPLRVWWEEHSDDHHAFNTGSVMLEAVKERFEVVAVERVPYFYRYIAAKCAERSSVGEFGEALFEIEERLIRAGRIKALGLRIVAVRN